MAENFKPFADLDCRLAPGASVVLRYPRNSGFLQGETVAACVGGHSKFWWWAGRVARDFLGLLTAIFFLYSLYVIIWNSGLSAQTLSTSLKTEDKRTLTYTYQVSQRSFQRTESTADRWNTRWESGNGQEKIRYLTFWPERSHLDFRVEWMSWGDSSSTVIDTKNGRGGA